MRRSSIFIKLVFDGLTHERSRTIGVWALVVAASWLALSVSSLRDELGAQGRAVQPRLAGMEAHMGEMENHLGELSSRAKRVMPGMQADRTADCSPPAALHAASTERASAEHRSWLSKAIAEVSSLHSNFGGRKRDH